MRKRCIVLVALLAALAGRDLAGQPAEFEGRGTVLGLDLGAGTVTLDHGPIPGLMPPMRMRLSVAVPEQLRRLKIGDVVRFSLGSRGDEITIVAIEPLDPSGLPSR